MPREPHTEGGSLHLPKDIGIATSVVEANSAEWNTIGRVNARLTELGFPENRVPDVELPNVTAEKLLTTDVKEFTVVYAGQKSWFDFVTLHLANVKAELLQVENELDYIAAQKRTDFRQLNESRPRTEKMTATEMEDAILLDPSYRVLKIRQQELAQFKLKTEAFEKIQEGGLRLVSRQIEVRKMDSASGNREANMPGHAAGKWEPSPYSRRGGP